MQVYMEKEAEDFLEKEGFSVVKRGVAKKEQDLIKICSKIKFPVVLKVMGKLHKSDVGGVKIDIRNDAEAIKAFKELKKIGSSILIQKFIKGESLLIGLKKDETFGHTLVFGAGGIYTEILKDVSFRICPVSLKEIREMLKETRIYPVLKGARGKKLNIKSLENVLLKMCKLAKKYPCIKELDINPLILNEKAVIADARIIFE